MALPTTLRGNQTAFSRSALPVSAYYPIQVTDWGQLGGAAPSLAYNAGAGSLAMSTARCAISWITAQGESIVSTEQTVAIAAGTGAFTITQPTVPTNGATVLGWRVYSSSGGAGTPLLNVAALSTTQAQSNIVTTQGTLLCFPVATTAVQVLIYGAGQAEPVTDFSGIQDALPSISANTTADVLVVVPASFDPNKEVRWSNPNTAVGDTAGVSITDMDCQRPIWIASNSYAQGAFIFTAGALFECTAAGTSSSNANFPTGFATVAAAQSGTVTDNGATWTYVGKQKSIVRIRFMNATGSAAIPTAQEYDLYQQ